MLRLRLSEVGKAFGQRVLFRNLCLEVEEGQFLAIKGPNGSGKTTLLKIIASLERPTRGQVEVLEGERVLEEEERRALMGFVGPDLVLYPDLTAWENLEFFAQVRGIPWDRDNFDHLLGWVGLEGRGWDRVRTFSSGMKQRLKLAFALFHQPRILLLDEPTTNLDADGIQRVGQLLADYRSQGILVVASNSPYETEGADQVVYLGASHLGDPGEGPSG